MKVINSHASLLMFPVDKTFSIFSTFPKSRVLIRLGREL